MYGGVGTEAGVRNKWTVRQTICPPRRGIENRLSQNWNRYGARYSDGGEVVHAGSW